jgi:pimeloyl-ACP methyl ester carboxylesterase
VTVEEVAFAGTAGLLAGGPSDTGVVIAHGGRGPGKHFFRDEVVALAERGHVVLAPDTRMPPRGDPEAELRGFEAVLEIHRQALDVLAERGARRFAFYGHSNGGIQGAALAAREPRLAALVIAAMGTGLVEYARRAGEFDPAYLAAVDRCDPIHFVATPGHARLFQYGVRDAVIDRSSAYALYEAAAEPKVWREYDCDHGVDADPLARLDRYAFLDEELRPR